jgi:5'-3' exonuclease
MVWRTSKDLYQEFGLHSRQWADYQAMVGESGDHVAGCPDWGPKTAGPALERFGSLEAILAATKTAERWQIKATEKQVAKLQKWAATDMERTLQLIRLRMDVPAVWDAVR